MSRSWLRELFSLGSLARIAIAVACAVGIWLGIDYWLDGRTSVTVDLGVVDRPIDLLAPVWLHLIAIVPAFFVLRVLSLTDLSLAQQILQAVLRSAVVAGIAIALARPSWIDQTTKVATVVLVDVSDSVSDKQLAAAGAYVDELDAAKHDGNLQMITFAEKAIAVRAGDGEKLSSKIARHVGAGAGTDIQSAMQLAYGMYPTGYLPRLVILSDGNQTVGDVAIEGYRAKQLGVHVSWQAFTADQTPEVRVVGVTAPDDIKVGQPFEVTAEVWSTIAQQVTLALQQDEFSNPLEGQKTVQLAEGKNLVKFKSDAKRAGATTYTLRLVKYEHDTEKANNQAVTTAPVKGRPSILYVEGSSSSEPGSARFLANALTAENMDVQVRGPEGIPSNPKELEKYDLVIVSDVPSYVMGAGAMAALDAYVGQIGGGLILAGGQDSFGAGGYQGTQIERISPVKFDSDTTKEQPDVALVLVLDRSGSMQGPKLEAAKESARATAEALAPEDRLAVVAFDSEATTYVPMQPAANRVRISNEIGRLQAGGGTNILPALKSAHEMLANVNAKVKHVILMTDGEAPTEGLAEEVADMRSQRITVSAVGVQGADQAMLGNYISGPGGGRLYMVEDIGALPKIFTKETQIAKKSSLVEDAIFARIAKRVEAIEGTNVEAAPPLKGYVATKPKPTSEVILISDRGEPLLARWRYGGGTAVVWTSDVKNRWSSEWVKWGGYSKFWAQVVRSSMRRKVYDSYDLTARVTDGRALVTVDAIDAGDKFVNELETTLQVIDPASGKVVQSLPMDQTAAGRYTADFKIQKYGSYLLKAIHQRDGKTVAESMGSVALSYPLEYLRSTPDLEPMRHAAEVSGGADRPAAANVWSPGTESIDYTQDLWPYVLLGVAALFLLDLYAKRVRLFGYRAIKFQ